MKIPVRTAGNPEPEDPGLENGDGGNGGESAAPAAFDDWKERYIRLAADFENFKRHANIERDRLAGLGKEAVLEDLLPLVGYMEAARKAVESAPDKAGIVAGLDLFYKQLLVALEKHGVERIPAQGQPFDPAIHEAVSVYICDDYADNSVIEEVKPGFRRHGKVLRPAAVVVAQNRIDRG